MYTNLQSLTNKKYFKSFFIVLFLFLFCCLSNCTSSIYLDDNLRKPDTIVMLMKKGASSGIGIGGIGFKQGTLFSFSNKYKIHPFPITLNTGIPLVLGAGGKKGSFIFKTGKQEATLFYSDVSFGLSKGFFSKIFSGLSLKFSFFTSLCIGTFNLGKNQAFYFVSNPNGANKPGETKGILKLNDKEIKIEGINKTDKEGAVASGRLYGYQFRYRGKVVAALNLGAEKKIWLESKLPAGIADPIVAVCSSLIHRKDSKSDDD